MSRPFVWRATGTQLLHAVPPAKEHRCQPTWRPLSGPIASEHVLLGKGEGIRLVSFVRRLAIDGRAITLSVRFLPHLGVA